MSIDPDVGAVLLAVVAGVGLTIAGLSRRGRRVCESCGRRVKSVLCACEQAVSEAVGAGERRVGELCDAHGLPGCTQCGPPQLKS